MGTDGLRLAIDRSGKRHRSWADVCTLNASVKKKGDAVAFIGDRLDQLRRTDVLVGIPADATLRKGSEINNASLLFVLTHGSPVNNIPPTPIIEPSIEKSNALISPHMAAAAKAILENSPQRAETELRRAGTIAMNGAKRYFTDPGNGWPPNAPSTIAKKGSSRRNIDTSQLRRAITYALRKVSGSGPLSNLPKNRETEGELHFATTGVGAGAAEGAEESAAEVALSVIEVL